MTVLWTPYGYYRVQPAAPAAQKRPIGFGAKPAPATSAPAKKSFGFDPKRTQGSAA